MLGLLGSGGAGRADAAAPPAPAKGAAAARPAPSAPATSRPSVEQLERVATGDLDKLIQRRVIRVLTTYSRTHYFIDKGVPRGLVVDITKQLEDELNRKLKTGHLRVYVVPMPVGRDELLPRLVEGRGDVVMASLTVTPEREKLVDFTAPTYTGLSEVVVTGPASPRIERVEDLAGQEVFVRRSSSFHASLVALNERFRREGRPEAILKPAPETLETEDLLEMLNAGLVKVVIADAPVAAFWRQVLPRIKVHEAVAVRTGGDLAWAIRPGSPRLKAALDDFVRRNRAGTTFGNVVLRKYLQSTKFVKSATAQEDLRRFNTMIDLFRRYGDRYEMDWLLMTAQGYQESQLDQSRRSPVGAVGVMQVMPATGKELEVGDIRRLEPNIHAGVKYMRFMIDRYYADEPMDPVNKGLFAFASYNAGPARVRQLRKEAAARGLDPNVWFNNVERIAAERIGRETVQYVSNIYKYYVAYQLVMEQRAERDAAKPSTGPAPAR
jgi:membrane-bound lytic murein transglycosylase MltF